MNKLLQIHYNSLVFNKVIFFILITFQITAAPFNKDVNAIGISGKVSSSDFPEGLPGVSVVVKGSTMGTITNSDGAYALNVPTLDAVLIYSFIGYYPLEVAINGRSIIDVQLKENTTNLQEVVVTGLSLVRDKNSLGYSVTQIANESLTDVKLNNPINSLAGRVAGLQISATPSGVDGSTRVVLRGVSSLTGSNRPLVVIDGIPVNGGSFGSAGVGGGKDMGDALSDINRNDVESMTILKGAGAAAIYGSRGANGVILVTTKKGSKNSGTGISLSSSYIIDQPFLFPKLQSTYGQGAFGTYPSNLIGTEEPWLWSWGPKMEGQSLTNWLGEKAPFNAQPDPFPLYYSNGFSAINTVSFDGGGENSSMRASFTNQDGQGIISTNKISKQTLNLRSTTKLGKIFELDGKVTYIHGVGKDRPYLAEDPANAAWAISTLPRNVPMSELEGNVVNSNGIENWIWDKTVGNPYWAKANKRNEDEKNRLQSLFSLKSDFSDNLNLIIRTGFDFLNRNTKEYASLGSSVNSNYRGNMNQAFANDIEWNSDFLLNYNKSVSDLIGVGLSVGGNYRYNKSKGIYQNGNGWRVPDFYNISNLENFSTGESFSEKEVMSLYTLGNISYSDFLYMDFSYRSDWSSTLPAANNRYPFYSLNGSFLFHDILNIPKSFLTKGQLRASYAVTGNDTGPYQTQNYYSVGQTVLPYPIGNLSSQLAFADFKPEIKTSIEVGTNLGFLGGRINFDIDYYSTVTDNQIMSVKLAPSSGFNSISQNAGSIQNNGIEALLNATIIESKKGLTWDVSLNATKNTSKVLSLADGQDRIVLQSSILNLATIEVRPGDPFGSIYGYDYARDDNGNKIVANGFPIKPSRGDYKRLGDINPRLTGGLSNRLRYGNFGLNFLVDFQLGGSFYSHGQLYRELMGTAENTLEGREEWYATHGGSGFLETIPGVIPKGYVEQGVIQNDGGLNDIPVDPMLRNLQVIWFNRTVADYIIDASNVRMREVSFSYNVPNNWIKKLPITRMDFSLVGRNLFFFYNAAINMDPESGYSSSTIGNAFELNSMPASRSLGFNLNVSF
jgi:TonB-linked SusC/RagA family outer membrane protein